MGAKWKINESDVSFGTTASTTTLRSERRQSRDLDERSIVLKLTHLPTGIGVEGVILKSHYSKKDLKKLKENMYIKLLEGLELKVARHLKIPGY